MDRQINRKIDFQFDGWIILVVVPKISVVVLNRIQFERQTDKLKDNYMNRKIEHSERSEGYQQTQLE